MKGVLMPELTPHEALAERVKWKPCPHQGELAVILKSPVREPKELCPSCHGTEAVLNVDDPL